MARGRIIGEIRGVEGKYYGKNSRGVEGKITQPDHYLRGNLQTILGMRGTHLSGNPGYYYAHGLQGKVLS